jgi:hypothetical protein
MLLLLLAPLMAEQVPGRPERSMRPLQQGGWRIIPALSIPVVLAFVPLVMTKRRVVLTVAALMAVRRP